MDSRGMHTMQRDRGENYQAKWSSALKEKRLSLHFYRTSQRDSLDMVFSPPAVEPQ
ncbi:hypothetical protein AOLI_G00139630 [Acnodon oligacanthus]